MSVRKAIAIFPILSLGLLAGCAGDNSGLLSTGSVTEEQKVAAAPKIDPVCLTLSARIAELRKEGTPERIKKVAEGKSTTANVKRSALAKLTELDTANQAFQQKCSSLTPAQRAAIAAQTKTATTETAKHVTTVAKTTAAATTAAGKAVSNAAAKADQAKQAGQTAATAAKAAAQ